MNRVLHRISQLCQFQFPEMKFGLKLKTNFTQQLKLLGIILGVIAVKLASSSLGWTSFLVHFIIQSVVCIITTILFIGTTFDALKDTTGLRKFETGCHVGSGVLLLLSAVPLLVSDRHAECGLIILPIMSIVLIAPLHLMIGWQIHATGIREPADFIPMYFFCSVTHDRVKVCLDENEKQVSFQVPPPPLPTSESPLLEKGVTVTTTMY